MPEQRVHARQRAEELGEADGRCASLDSPRREQPRSDLSHPAIAVNLDACIQCTRCVRACREVQVNDVIGYAYRGEHSEDRVRLRRPDGRVHLRRLRRVRAGLPDRRARCRRASVGLQKADKTVDSVCPFCGVGCLLTYHVKDNKILYVERQGRPVEPRPPVREGPLRLRLRAPSAPADQAADPQGRACRKSARLHGRPGQLVGACSARRPGKRRSSWPPAG